MNIFQSVSEFLVSLKNIFNPIFQLFLAFFNPVVAVFSASFGIISFLLGAISNPQGWMNATVVAVIDYIAVIWPSTPDDLKVGNMLAGIVDTFPSFGTSIVVEVFESVALVIGLVAIIKIYKLIPFKFS